jgi:dUTP pyrophosphatase
MSAPVPVRVSLLEHAVAPPSYQTEHAAGMDLVAAVADSIEIPAGGIVAVPTGIRIEIPPGYEGQVRPRSGLAAKHGIGIPNAPGTIDADYRGEVQVLLVNLGAASYTVRRGRSDRSARPGPGHTGPPRSRDRAVRDGAWIGRIRPHGAVIRSSHRKLSRDRRFHWNRRGPGAYSYP